MFRASNPDHVPLDVQMLREVEHSIRVLAWQQTKDATLDSPKNYPERIPLTSAAIAAAKERAPLEAAPLPIEELNDWLGWPERPHGN